MASSRRPVRGKIISQFNHPGAEKNKEGWNHEDDRWSAHLYPSGSVLLHISWIMSWRIRDAIALIRTLHLCIGIQ